MCQLVELGQYQRHDNENQSKQVVIPEPKVLKNNKLENKYILLDHRVDQNKSHTQYNKVTSDAMIKLCFDSCFNLMI